jgi:hypothetical protein
VYVWCGVVDDQVDKGRFRNDQSVYLRFLITFLDAAPSKLVVVCHQPQNLQKFGFEFSECAYYLLIFNLPQHLELLYYFRSSWEHPAQKLRKQNRIRPCQIGRRLFDNRRGACGRSLWRLLRGSQHDRGTSTLPLSSLSSLFLSSSLLEG